MCLSLISIESDYLYEYNISFNPKITRKGLIDSPPIAHKAQGFESLF